MKTVVIEGENGDFTIVSHDGNSLGRMTKAERIAYWQRQGEKEIFNAAWELIHRYCAQNGLESRIDRSVEFYSKDLSDMR